jgi:hypothetical protein
MPILDNFQSQFRLAVALTPPQIPEANAVIVAGVLVMPMQVATPLESMLVDMESEVLHVTCAIGPVLSILFNKHAPPARSSLPKAVLRTAKFPVALNWTVLLGEL